MTACVFPKCPKESGLGLDLPICLAHATIIRDRLAVVEAQHPFAKREAAHAQQLATSTQRINDGQMPAQGHAVPGWVYYIRVNDVIKIGYAKSVTARMKHYPPNATLLAVEPGTLELEKRRHDHFHAHLAWGREWFHPTNELLTWIEQLRATFNPAPLVHKYRRAG